MLRNVQYQPPRVRLREEVGAALATRNPGNDRTMKAPDPFIPNVIKFKMAGDTKLEERGGKVLNLCCKLEPSSASASLQNCLKTSSSGKYISVLCEFGIVLILDLRVTEGESNITTNLVKRLPVTSSELLEGHAWSSDDELFAVASCSCKVHVFQVSKDFASVLSLSLYYIPKDISFIKCDAYHQNSVLLGQPSQYQLAVAGPNGVEIYCLENKDSETLKVGDVIPLHADLAIALVVFSPDKKYLAVAAVDNHFGIWEVSSLATSSNNFWYVHLKTIRITSIEFSNNSDMIAIGCWDGACHVYRKVDSTERFAWEEMTFNWVTTTDRVSGTLPGSFVSWSSDAKYLRTTHSKDKRTIIATYDVQGNTSSLAVVSQCPGDSLKGITSFRSTAGDFSLYFTKSDKLCVLKWPSVCTSFGGELLLENMFGTVWVDKESMSEGVTFLWRTAPKQLVDVVTEFELGNCKPVLKVRESVATVEHGKSVTACSTSQFGGESQTTGKRHEGSAMGLTEEHSFVQLDGLSFDREDGLSVDKLESLSIKNKNEECSLSTKCRKHENTTESIESDCSLTTPSKRKTDTYCSDHLVNKQNNYEHLLESKYVLEIKTVHAPFMNPIMFSSLVRDNACEIKKENSISCITPDCNLKVLMSPQYLVVAFLPILAYVYREETSKWQATLFREPVENCCIAAGKYMVALKENNTVAVWFLETAKCLGRANVQLRAERSVMAASLSLCRASIINLNAFGKGEIITVSFNAGSSDSHLSVRTFQVFLPNLALHPLVKSLYGMVGRFLVFWQNEKQTEGREPSGIWLFVLPEMNISRSFTAMGNSTLADLLMENYHDLQKLQSLVN